MPYGITRERKLGPGRSSRPFMLLTLFLVSLASVGLTVCFWRSIGKLIFYLYRESHYDKIIVEAGRRNGVDPCLIKAVIWRESSFRAGMKGKKGEIGLMQVMPDRAASDWARIKRCPGLTAGALYDPELNIEVGSWYLGRAVRRWKDYRYGMELALCEYNAGLRRANEWKPETLSGEVHDRIKIASTKRYVSDIVKRCWKYKKEWKIPE